MLGGGNPDLWPERGRDGLVPGRDHELPGKPAVAEGLGLLPGSACVHYLTEPVRRRRFLRAIAAGELEPGLGLEDQTGALFEDTELLETISAREGAAVWGPVSKRAAWWRPSSTHAAWKAAARRSTT